MQPDADVPGLEIAGADDQHGMDLGPLGILDLPVDLVGREIGLDADEIRPQLLDDPLRVIHQRLLLPDGEDADLLRSQPEREIARVMLDQEADEPLVGPQRSPVDAQRRLVGEVEFIKLAWCG